MNSGNDGAGKARGKFANQSVRVDDGALHKVLGDFRLSVHAWSEAAYVQPRTAGAAAAVKTGRKAVVWALGCVLAATAVGGGMYEHHRKELAQIAAQREAQRQISEQRARETEDLLARVDSDVSREVPDALEPLAQLMDDDGSR